MKTEKNKTGLCSVQSPVFVRIYRIFKEIRGLRIKTVFYLKTLRFSW